MVDENILNEAERIEMVFFFSFLYYVHAVRKLRQFLEETGQSFWVLVWKFFAIQKWKK